MPYLAIAGLAMSAASAASQASASQTQAGASYEAAKINQEWSEFERQLEITRQRGVMGLNEFSRLGANRMIEKESLQNLVYSRRAAREAESFQTLQYVRASRVAKANAVSSMASRGTGSGGTSDAIKRQLRTDAMNDLARIRVNTDNQVSMFTNQRNAALKQRNMAPSTQPPVYLPATPIQAPVMDGMMMGAMLGAIGPLMGGLAGKFDAAQPEAGMPGSPYQGPPAPSGDYSVPAAGSSGFPYQGPMAPNGYYSVPAAGSSGFPYQGPPAPNGYYRQ